MIFKNYFSALLLFCLLFLAPSLNAAEIWVSISGNDNNIGSKEAPLATLNMALRKARNMRRLNDPSSKDGIRIVMMEGTYFLNEPIFIRPEDSGTKESPTIIEAQFPGESILSGGFQIKGWKKSDRSINGLKPGQIWVADAPKKAGHLLSYRQLWVNGKKATRAKSTSKNEMDRILSWDKETESCWIPFKDTSIKFEPGMEMFIVQWWAIANLRIRELEIRKDSARVFFHQPESRIQSEHPWPAPWISKNNGNSAFYLTNGLSMLDEPGEWYLDRQKEKLYYYPKEDENIQSSTFMVPVLENLVEIKGTIDAPVQHIYIKDLSFQYSNWLRPSQQGHVPIQAGMYLLDAYKLKKPGTPDKASLENQAWIGRPRAAVEVNFAHHLQFKGCRFEHLSSTGLDLNRGTKNNLIQGNLFKDIGGSAINVGVFSEEAFETHLPYNPKDERVVCSDEVIADNLITNVTNEDWGTIGIAAGFVKNITIEHNEISDVSYSGISLGWGWTPTLSVMRNNKVLRNKIHHYAKHLHDVAGVYTLSSQPNSQIEENYIDHVYHSPYAHDPFLWLYLYTDEGTSYFTIKNNWIPIEKNLQNNNGPAGNVWENNNPYVDAYVKENAGIRAPYHALLQKEVVIDTTWGLQKLPEPVVIELEGSSLDISKIKSTLKGFRIVGETYYQWKNHLVVYGKLNQPERVKRKLSQRFPELKLKIYDKPLYDFKITERCANPRPASEWEHIVLTTNLVEDPIKQEKYEAYHKTQFEQWPEVAQGFCNADFQQLQVFKKGRQLMLVISIPKGKSLEELNPKTTENNPRVEDWNALMQSFQTGIQGTKKGETWVFFKKITFD